MCCSSTMVVQLRDFWFYKGNHYVRLEITPVVLKLVIWISNFSFAAVDVRGNLSSNFNEVVSCGQTWRIHDLMKVVFLPMFILVLGLTFLLNPFHFSGCFRGLLCCLWLRCMKWIFFLLICKVYLFSLLLCLTKRSCNFGLLRMIWYHWSS